MITNSYTFGDSEQASARLRRLAELYEQETRELLQAGQVRKPHLSVDLGCGPGWSTRLLHEVLRPDRTIGLDASERYIAEARRIHRSGLEFEVHDVVHAPFPVRGKPDVLFCRFLLTHLCSLSVVLSTWASIAAPNALLFVHETESLKTEHPALRRYYDLVAELQQQYGQTLLVGSLLDASFAEAEWQIVESNRRILEKPASRMAELHLANLRSWRQDKYASAAFDPDEIDALEISLAHIAQGVEKAGIVVNAARQVIAKRM
jgi:ubiquinone/menaquinone biosynthesis C-methylase UbiE